MLLEQRELQLGAVDWLGLGDDDALGETKVVNVSYVRTVLERVKSGTAEHGITFIDVLFGLVIDNLIIEIGLKDYFRGSVKDINMITLGCLF